MTNLILNLDLNTRLEVLKLAEKTATWQAEYPDADVVEVVRDIADKYVSWLVPPPPATEDLSEGEMTEIALNAAAKIYAMQQGKNFELMLEDNQKAVAWLAKQIITAYEKAKEK
jgi:hypothetical protein